MVFPFLKEDSEFWCAKITYVDGSLAKNENVYITFVYSE